MKMTPSKLDLQNIEKINNRIIKEFAFRWWEIVVQIHPSLL
jgi:hypothetical protein